MFTCSPRLVADHPDIEPCTKIGRGPVPFYPSPSKGVRFIYLFTLITVREVCTTAQTHSSQVGPHRCTLRTTRDERPSERSQQYGRERYIEGVSTLIHHIICSSPHFLRCGRTVPQIPRASQPVYHHRTLLVRIGRGQLGPATCAAMHGRAPRPCSLLQPRSAVN